MLSTTSYRRNQLLTANSRKKLRQRDRTVRHLGDKGAGKEEARRTGRDVMTGLDPAAWC
jgi:hypothetical protein